MPKNNNLKPIKFPQKIKFGEKPETEFVNNLESIKVKLKYAPSMEELLAYIPEWAKATWMEDVNSCRRMPIEEKLKTIRKVFMGKTLPSAKETINLVFEIDGISIQEVTHILRHRSASFSADCSADKWWTHKRALVPNAIQQSTGEDWCPFENASGAVVNREDFYTRYKQIVIDAKQLYCDMIDSRDVSILDARTILPRCLETFYYMRIPLKDAIDFINQRKDRQIQPETDNVMAYYMYLELLKKYPVANGMIDIDAPAQHFINTARSGDSSNIYLPEENSDLFEWNEKDFLYCRHRNELNGTDRKAFNTFDKYLDWVRIAIERQEDLNRFMLAKCFKLSAEGLENVFDI